MSNSEAIDAGQRLRNLVSGTIEPPNEYVAYHVKMARAAQKEHEALVQTVTRADQQLAALKHRALMLRAQLETHLQSIAAWDESAAQPAGPGPAVL
jgi:hypothetical protein